MIAWPGPDAGATKCDAVDFENRDFSLFPDEFFGHYMSGAAGFPGEGAILMALAEVLRILRLLSTRAPEYI